MFAPSREAGYAELGITPPAGHGKQFRTTCPRCSHQRKNSREACLSIIEDDEGFQYKCHHCGEFEGGVIVRANGEHRPPKPKPKQPSKDEQDRREWAGDIWQKARPIGGTPAQTYLVRTRGITIPLPKSIRFIESLKHKPSNTWMPAMITGVSNTDGRFLAIQRSWLLEGGRGRYKPDEGNGKMTLGDMGNGCARLAKHGTVLGLAEGVETALSVMQLFGVPCWAVLGRRFKAVAVPEDVRSVVIFGDNGLDGSKAATAAVHHFRALGKMARVEFPHHGLGDFNDQLRKG